MADDAQKLARMLMGTAKQTGGGDPLRAIADQLVPPAHAMPPPVSYAPTGTQWKTLSQPGTNPFNGLNLEVAINPSRGDIARIARESEGSAARLIKDANGNVYAWDAFKGTHGGVAQMLGFDSTGMPKVEATPADLPNLTPWFRQ